MRNVLPLPLSMRYWFRRFFFFSGPLNFVSKSPCGWVNKASKPPSRKTELDIGGWYDNFLVFCRLERAVICHVSTEYHIIRDGQGLQAIFLESHMFVALQVSSWLFLQSCRFSGPFW